MYSSVRRYTANPGLAENFAWRRDEIRKAIQAVPGFISYYLLKTADGAVSVTMCEDREGAETSNQVATDWIRDNMPNVVARPPEIYEGEIVISTMAGAGAVT